MNIECTPAKEETWDLMQGNDRMHINVDGQHGFVALVDMMPRIVPRGRFADSAIVQAARVSYGNGTKTVSEDSGLIRYLYRNTHTTPYEMVEFKLHCQMPIFIARQWIRHRTASVNEASARYSIMKDQFWIPSADEVRAQSNKNKQVSEGHLAEVDSNDFCGWVDDTSKLAYYRYESAVKRGVGREQARVMLPLNIYTEWYWKMDLHNLFHFLGLRMHEHAQKEMRDYANAIYALVSPMVPTAAKAFMDYHHHMGGMKLSALEIDAIKRGRMETDFTESLGNPYHQFFVAVIDSDNKRERQESYVKFDRMGLKYHKHTEDTKG